MALVLGNKQSRLLNEDAYESDHKASTIFNLISKGQAHLATSLSSIVEKLDASSAVKIAVCQAIAAAGSPQAANHFQTVKDLSRDADDNVRYHACLALGVMTSIGNAAQMRAVECLADHAECVRFAACLALGTLQAVDCVEYIRNMLQDESVEVQGAACVALARLGVAVAEEVAERLRKPRSRLLALTALGLMGTGAGYCQEVCECLTDDDAEIRLCAAATIGQMAAEVHLDLFCFGRLLELLDHQDGQVRCAAALALGYMGSEAFDKRHVLRHLVKDSFEESAVTALTVGGCSGPTPATCRKARCAAAVALGRIAGPNGLAEDAEAVGKLLDSEDWEVRICGLEALALMGAAARSQSTRVMKMMKDKMYIVRAKAAVAVSKLRSSQLYEDLANLLDDPCPSVREQALLAFAELGEDGDSHVNQVRSLLDDKSDNVRAACYTALGNLGERGHYCAGIIVQNLSQESEPLVVAAAIDALGCMEQRGAVYADLVSAFEKHPHPSVRAAAVRSLPKMGVQSSKLRSIMR